MINETLFKHSKDPAQWAETQDAFTACLAGMDIEAMRDPDEETRKEAFAPAQIFLKSISNARWQNDWRFYYTIGKADTEKLTQMAARGMLNWQAILNAKAAFGQGKDVESIAEQAELNGKPLNMNAALISAARPQLLTTGLMYRGNAESCAVLLQLDATPAYDNGGALFIAAVEKGDPEVGRAFARAAAFSSLDLNKWFDWARRNERTLLARKLQPLIWDYGRFDIVDPETLVETKELPDDAKLKLIFNFAAERVTEIYDYKNGNGRGAIKTDYLFQEYDLQAIEQAREKLSDLGGRPSETGGALAGKKLAPTSRKPSLGSHLKTSHSSV